MKNAVDIITKFIKNFMILSSKENNFISEFNKNNYDPTSLFDELDIVNRIKNHPMVIWKLNHNK